MTLKASDLEEIRGLNENISLDEVVDIYLPISRLLHLYYSASRELYAARREFLGTKHEKITFIIGIAGSVAVGKSTTARLLKTLISAWPDKPTVDLIPTDGYIFPNSVLKERNIMNRKGFPESFNVKGL
ncbi:pantothenate kinase, partial [mine drainage metagenome]